MSVLKLSCCVIQKRQRKMAQIVNQLSMLIATRQCPPINHPFQAIFLHRDCCLTLSKFKLSVGIVLGLKEGISGEHSGHPETYSRRHHK